MNSARPEPRRAPVRILHLEDSYEDGELVREMLEAKGLHCEIWRVVSHEEFQTALEEQDFQLILSDFTLPSYDGLRALALARQARPSIPFIFFSGTIGEEVAIESLKHGASDYILKTRPDRLVSAVERALRELHERKERQEIEAQLRQSENWFHQISESVEDLIALFDPKGALVFGSRSYKEFRAGLAADPELEFLTGVHPEDRDQIRQIFRETLATGLAQRHEHRFVSPNGSEHLLESHTSAIRDNDGKVTHVLSVSRDITERQRAAAHIQQQSALLDNLRDAIYLCSLDGRILFWNKRCEDIYGWRSHEAVGQDPERLLGDKKSFEAAAPNAALTGKDAIVECERSTKDGRKITVQSQRTVLRDGQECATAILCVDFDLSEWKAYTRRSLQTQQFDFTGALLQAAAQDLSRVLSPFLLACGQAARGNWNESVNRALDTTRLHMDRASEIVQQLGLFAEAMHPRFAAIEIAPILEEMVAMLRGAMPHSIQIETSIAPDLPPIWGDASHLHQILIELCRNAREAMPGGGRLHIRADHKTFEARPHWMLDQPAAGDYVAITITDEGVGLPRPLAEKIFQPYFSLKKQDPNSGLGLSIVFALVKSHRGFIDVDADLSQGSSFQVFLPAHSTVAKLGLHAPPAAAPMGRGETLLLVDDHRLLREAARQLLEMFSYSVCTASNASAALELYRAKQTQIAAVIVDLVMPFDEGPGLMRALRAINPGVKMIAITGQGPWASQIDPTLQPRAYLTKPYRIEKLLLLLRTQLEG